MLWYLFIVLLGLGLTAVLAGLRFPEHSELSIIGFTILFLVSLSLLNDTLLMKSGEVITKNYANASLTSESVSYVYSTSGSPMTKTIGWILAASSAIGFAITLFNIGGEREDV